MIILCTICSDIVNQAENIHVTKCGHVFHFNCLNEWIARSKTCPQCRNRVTEKCMFRIYPNTSNIVNEDDAAANLQVKVDNLMLQMREKTVEIKTKNDKIDELEARSKKQDDSIKNLQKRLATEESAKAAFQEQVKYLKSENKETKKLAEENDNLKKNLVLLQGLQKVFNSTVGEVEQMLEGYTDLRTIATFATALKKALYESEAKKTELRNRLQASRQELAMEKKNCAEWQAKYIQSEENLSATTKNYEALKEKLKQPKTLNTSYIDETWHSMLKPKDPSPDQTYLDDTILVSEAIDTSLNTMVKKIEDADSPYLNLKQSNLALATLQRPSTSMAPKFKPSEFAMLNSAKATATRKLENLTNKDLNLSIFHKKDPKKMEFSSQKEDFVDLNVTYDGLGGHSKLDTFPVPKNNNWKPKSSVPKLTAKHKLKRPNPAGGQDIGEMLKKLKEK